MKNEVFTYNGSPITFQLGNGAAMINATEMAKPFGKRPVDWLQNNQTQDFIKELSKVRKSTLADLVIVTKGGNNSGTWMHEDVAIEFARWLAAAICKRNGYMTGKCNDMRFGQVKTYPKDVLSKLLTKV